VTKEAEEREFGDRRVYPEPGTSSREAEATGRDLASEDLGSGRAEPSLVGDREKVGESWLFIVATNLYVLLGPLVTSVAGLAAVIMAPTLGLDDDYTFGQVLIAMVGALVFFVVAVGSVPYLVSLWVEPRSGRPLREVLSSALLALSPFASLVAVSGGSIGALNRFNGREVLEVLTQHLQVPSWVAVYGSAYAFLLFLILQVRLRLAPLVEEREITRLAGGGDEPGTPPRRPRAVSRSDLRKLERRFRETRTVEDETAWLWARKKAGKLDGSRLGLAAFCGHRAAGRVLGEAATDPGLSALLRRLRDHSPVAGVRALIALARQCQAQSPPDSDIEEQLALVDAAEEWCLNTTRGEDELRARLRRWGDQVRPSERLPAYWFAAEAAAGEMISDETLSKAADCVQSAGIGGVGASDSESDPREEAARLALATLRDEVVAWVLGYDDPVRLRVAERREAGRLSRDGEGNDR
jgi:hypothetical protein